MEMSDKSLKPFDAAALTDAAGPASDASAEAASSQAAPEQDQATQAGAAPTAPAKAPAFVTHEDFMAIMDERDRRLQSSLDKRDRNLQRLVAQQQARENAQSALEAAQASGIVIPPDKQPAFLKALAEKGLLGGDGQTRGSAPTDPTAADSEGADGEALDPVTAQGYAIAQMYGLTGEDPEAAQIRTDSPQAYLQSITLAGQQKLARLARAEHPNPARMPGLTPGGGPAKTDLSKKPRSELLKTEVRAAMKRG